MCWTCYANNLKAYKTQAVIENPNFRDILDVIYKN